MKDVAAAIMVDSGKVFIARRAPGEKLAGNWEFPGGKVEEGETPEQCLKRELLEELGVFAEVKDFFTQSVYEYPRGTIRLLTYFVELLSADFNLRVHDRYEWVDFSRLKEYDLSPADIPVAAKIAREL